MAVLLAGAAPVWAAAAEPPAMLSAQAARDSIGRVLTAPAFSAASSASVWLLGAGMAAALAAVAILVLMAASQRRAHNACTPPVYTAMATGTAGPVIEDARRLWPHEPAAAVGRLYQGLLARLATDYQLIVPPGDTEPEVCDRVASLRLAGLEDFTRRLADAQARACYAGAPPSDATWEHLCASWRRLFPTDEPA